MICQGIGSMPPQNTYPLIKSNALPKIFNKKSYIQTLVNAFAN
jgi:hypothetical protein